MLYIFFHFTYVGFRYFGIRNGPREPVRMRGGQNGSEGGQIEGFFSLPLFLSAGARPLTTFPRGDIKIVLLLVQYLKFRRNLFICIGSFPVSIQVEQGFHISHGGHLK